jgi:hypothetical protein
MTNTQKRNSLLVEIRGLETTRAALVKGINDLSDSALRYLGFNETLKDKEDAIDKLEKKYFQYYRKDLLTIEEVAGHLGLDPKMLLALMDQPVSLCDFRSYLFPSDSKQDHYRISVRELARHVIDNSH